MNDAEKLIRLLELLDEAEQLLSQYSGGYSNRFLSAEEFHAHFVSDLEKFKQGDTIAFRRLYTYFQVTCDWDDLVGMEGMHLGNEIFGLLCQLSKNYP